MAAAECGAIPVGIDISQVAINACRQLLPKAELHCGLAEVLPFEDKRFDVISCLGSLEHFLDQKSALKEMMRIAKPAATFLFCVPNADFLTRRLGLYYGTQQADVYEYVQTLAGWEDLFDSAGLRVTRRWKDLHVLSWSWIAQGRWYFWPVRASQALVLPFWPISWQYQVYHHCQIK
jgi:ubiquinone/menaquinone biosynthesis C-methylase UbiE